MFTKKKMEKALSWLFSLFRADDFGICTAEEITKLFNDLCLSEICMALRDKAQTVYQYTLETTAEDEFEYRGKELFRMRGCKVYSELENGSSNKITSTYERELWLLEDMSFALVHCVLVGSSDEKFAYVSEYRTIIKRFEGRNDLFMNPEKLMEKLEEMCIPQWEDTATIYEM